MIKTKRVYATPAEEDGLRVLVDRLWPRGLSRDKARIDHWLKDAAPSNELRRWFGHDPSKWEEFRERYFRELDSRSDTMEELRDMVSSGPVTLLFGARDEVHNQARALKEYLAGRTKSR